MTQLRDWWHTVCVVLGVFFSLAETLIAFYSGSELWDKRNEEKLQQIHFKLFFDCSCSAFSKLTGIWFKLKFYVPLLIRKWVPSYYCFYNMWLLRMETIEKFSRNISALFLFFLCNWVRCVKLQWLVYWKEGRGGEELFFLVSVFVMAAKNTPY